MARSLGPAVLIQNGSVARTRSLEPKWPGRSIPGASVHREAQCGASAGWCVCPAVAIILCRDTSHERLLRCMFLGGFCLAVGAEAEFPKIDLNICPRSEDVLQTGKDFLNILAGPEYPLKAPVL